MSDVVVWVVGILGSTVSGYVLHLIKKQDEHSKAQDEKIENLTNVMAELKITSVPENDIRKMIKEEISPIVSNNAKITEMLSTLSEWVAEERGFRKGLNAAQQANNKVDQ